MMATPSSEAPDGQVEWLSTLRDIEDEICVTEQHIEANVKSNDAYKEAYIHSVETCREDLIARLDQLVDKAKNEGMSIHKRNDNTLKQLAKTCKETQDTIEEQKTIVRDLSQKKQPRQLYVILRTELQDMRSVIKQSSFQSNIVKFTFENNSKVQNFLKSDIQDIGTLQELCTGSDEVVDDTHSLSNLSSLTLKTPPPLPPKPGKTLQKNEMKICELNNDDIVLDTSIYNLGGTGFEVYQGVLKKPSRKPIAVKACFETMSEEQGKALATEGILLMHFDHKNIVKLIGIAAQRKPVMLVMEQFSDGVLRTYLLKNGQNMTHIQKANSCLDVANGMVYLSKNRCLHMDLRAGTCMVGDNQVVKIFNFAYAIEGDEYDNHGNTNTRQFPIKWTAPELFTDGKYTTMCDVWSYGILMWEIFSNGMIPYPGWTYSLAFDKVEKGYRMPAPENTPDSIYQLMLRCWDANPSTRITFKEICTTLTHLMDNPPKEEHWSK